MDRPSIRQRPDKCAGGHTYGVRPVIAAAGMVQVTYGCGNKATI